MAAVQELVEALAARFPDDAEELERALEVLQKQRITSCDRLRKLSDSQWQRLDLPIGIEALLRDEAAVAPEPTAAPAPMPPAAGGGHGPRRQPTAAAPPGAAPAPVPAAPPSPVAPPTVRPAWTEPTDDGELPLEAYEPPVGLHCRRGTDHRAVESMRRGGSSSGSGVGSRARGGRQAEKKGGFTSDAELVPPLDLEELWQQLLEDTLPPDRRKLLQDSWEKACSEQDRYMMYLEYTSYLRRPEISEEEQEERRKQLEPLLREFGMGAEEESGCPSGILWTLLLGVLLFAAGLVYYMYAQPDPVHDLQAL